MWMQYTLKGDLKITADIDYVYYKDNNYLTSLQQRKRRYLRNTKSTKLILQT